MKTISKNKLKQVLHNHELWLQNRGNGIKADLSGFDLIGADLNGANLKHANLSNAYLGHARLGNADLSQANLSGASLQGADLSLANLTVDLSGMNLTDADLSGADLSGSNLSGAIFKDANLYEANLLDCDLSNADFRGAILNDVRGITFVQTNWNDGKSQERSYGNNLVTGIIIDNKPVYFFNDFMGSLRAFYDLIHAKQGVKKLLAIDTEDGDCRSLIMILESIDGVLRTSLGETIGFAASTKKELQNMIDRCTQQIAKALAPKLDNPTYAEFESHLIEIMPKMNPAWTPERVSRVAGLNGGSVVNSAQRLAKSLIGSGAFEQQVESV